MYNDLFTLFPHASSLTGQTWTKKKHSSTISMVDAYIPMLAECFSFVNQFNWLSFFSIFLLSFLHVRCAHTLFSNSKSNDGEKKLFNARYKNRWCYHEPLCKANFSGSLMKISGLIFLYSLFNSTKLFHSWTDSNSIGRV